MARLTKNYRMLIAITWGMGLGCSSEPDNIGDGNVAVDKTKLSSYAASWDGYVEAYAFQSGSDHVRVVLDEAGNGSLRVGNGDLLQPATDPDVGYPVPLANGNDPLMNSYTYELFDGIAYPLIGARIEQERIRFGVDPHAAFGDWCALQESQLTFNAFPEYYTCLPASGWGTDASGTCTTEFSAGGPPVVVDCAFVAICASGCACDATSCGAATSRPESLALVDAALDDDGESLEGTLLYNDGPRTVRLSRE